MFPCTREVATTAILTVVQGVNPPAGKALTRGAQVTHMLYIIPSSAHGIGVPDVNYNSGLHSPGQGPKGRQRHGHRVALARGHYEGRR